MSAWPDIAALFTAFFAGLLGSGHCFGMCGGIAAGLSHVAAPSEPEQSQASPVRTRLAAAVLFNLGRVSSYAILGALAAWLLAGAGEALAVPRWGRALRLLTAAMIFGIGLQFLANLQLLGFIEKTGARVWKYVQPWAARASRRPGASGRLLLGLCWGLLPCGLVYSVLATAATAGAPLQGGLVMVAFGLGTLPSMVGMGLLAPAIRSFLADRWTRKLMGLAMILLAIYSASMVWWR
jgi:sulfite exporter TauE/SafE